ncbi:hypothetical protein DEU56DRAFT_919445 [Suillus clintonianus]|uniref:uncharacterized protein n=1 Tax=Suillus clintonianus TaxID=1904413 RepID=UPI001B87F85B|nr:uncharacterized protein DEU56DRAFT_919445 [Suillus clintonianus]KAG2115031.1 hypothetical protein DEU56DRAFT_919445 [Suillus clintonianus]
MYPPESLFQSSPILPKVDYAEAFTRVYRDSPQSSSPPSSLCPSSSPPASVTSLGHADSSYHPYVRKTPPTPQAERKMANVMGRLRLTGGMDSDLDDDMGLQRLSSEGMRRAAYYKEAELEYHRHLSMALAWEAKKLSRLRDFIDCEQQEQEGQTIRAFEEAELFTRMVADRDAGRASQDLEFITSIQQEEAARVKQLNSELDELDIFLSPDTQATSDLEQQRQCESE